MNFNVIGGIPLAVDGGGCGTTARGGSIGAGGGDGAAFDLKRNRFRSTLPGSGFGLSSVSSLTTGAARAGATCLARAGFLTLDAVWLPAVVGDVPSQSQNAMPARLIASTARSTWRRCSGAIGPQAEIGRQIHGQRERFVLVRFSQRHIVDDHELLRRLQLINERAKTVVVARQAHTDIEMPEQRIFLDVVHGKTPLFVLDVGLACERRQT